MKRIVSLILAISLLLSVPMLLLPAAAEEAVLCQCGCGREASQVQWKPWNVNVDGAPADGHYYLTEDYAQSKQHTIMAGDRVAIDLRGKTLTTSGYGRLFLVYGYLAVLDSVGGGRMCSKTTGTAFGGVVMVGQNETADPTFAFYSGMLTVDADNKNSRAGGLVTVGGGCHFVMYGGTLLGGSTTERGGAIQGSANSDIQILGGSIIGCKSTEAGGAIYSKGNVLLKNCFLSGNEAGGTDKGYGGNICSEGGSLTIENAIIESGVSNAIGNGGGNIFALSDCAVSIKDSTIRNGYAANYGGNLCFGTCTQNLENVKVYGGAAGKSGDNLYVNASGASTTITGGEIVGDVHYANAKLTLKGAAKIGTNGGALKLGSGTQIDASGLTPGAEIYVDAEGTFTKNGANDAYFKPAFRTVLSTADGQLVGAQAESGVPGGYCPHCKKNVTWTAASETLSGHCYLTGNVTTGYTITGDTVLDLRGYSVTASGRAFKVEAGASLTLLDSVGSAVVKGSGVAGESGGVIHNAGTLNIYGGNYTYVAGKSVVSGGVIYADGNVNLYGGVYNGITYENTAETALGGVLNMSAGTRTLTMTAGRVLGGEAYRGGGFCFGSNNIVNIAGGNFLGGTAAGAGGNIRFNGTSGSINATIKNTVFYGGTTATSGYGGSLSVNYCNVSLTDCTVLSGSAGAYGGNIHLGTRADLTATETFVAGGSAPKGGNVYAASYLSSADFTDCIITGGDATGTTGGNLMVNHGNVQFNGGEISYGTAKTHGGNVYTNGGNYDHKDAKDDGFRLYASEKGAPIVTTGNAKTGAGGNIYSCGITMLDAAFINNGTASSGQDVYYDAGKTAYSITIGSGLTGTIRIFLPKAVFDGSVVSNSAAVPFAGKLILEGQMGEPALTVKDGQLMMGGIALFHADGSLDWFVTMEEAAQEAREDSYIKMFADGSLVMTRDCTVDVNGKTLTVSGNYTLYGMDSSGDDYSVGTGKVILKDGAKTTQRTTVVDGREYISIVDGDTATYHRLGMRLTDVTLRTSNCGMFYKATWDCDSVLAALVERYGIVANVYGEPGADFATDGTSLSVDYDGTELMHGQKREGVTITNIMKESLNASENDKRGQLPVHAKAYLRMKDGTLLLSGCESYSLKTAMERLDHLISTDPTHFRRYTNNARSFFETWKGYGMDGWSFTNLITPEKDDVIDIIMIGSSSCYYYVEELYALAAAAGVKMRVCNVYYSGCTLQMHYNWWINDQSMYQFYVTDGNGRKQYNNVSLEYCLAQGDWDIISLQQASGTIRKYGGAKHFNETAPYSDVLVPYLRQEFPNAELLWHQGWSYQIGYNRDGYQVTSLEQQDRDAQCVKDYVLLACERYNVRRVNTAEAWQIVRHGGYDNLCARLIINNGEGDYYHDGDIGGGQYLNACVWFEVITGQSCLGNSYIPVYTHNGQTYTLDADFIATLQKAAHEAVASMQ